MARSYKIDWLLHVIFPVLAGILLYLFSTVYSGFHLLRNYLPDGCWAYAFTSCMLIIWERRIHWVWISVVLICFPLFEGLQYVQLVNGTADWVDLFTYYAFAALALLLNHLLYAKQLHYDSKVQLYEE